MASIPARAASAGQQDGIDLINALANHPETARRLVTKLYNFFVSETIDPSSAFIDQLALEVPLRRRGLACGDHVTLRPVDVRPAAEVSEILEKLKAGRILGRTVLAF